MRKKSWLAGALILGSVALAALTADRLKRLGVVPERPAPYYLAFLAAFLLAAVSGWAARERSSALASPASPIPLRRGRVAVRLIAAAVAAGLFVWTAILQRRPEPPLTVLLVWAVSMIAVVLAFPGLRPEAEEGDGRRKYLTPVMAASLGVLVLAACARFIGLDRVHPVLAGDEATVASHGAAVLKREWRSDPFGTGVQSSNQLPMLLAGAGALASDNPISGPRFPYALIGTLSVAASGAAAGLLAGPWAALAAVALLAFAPHHLHFSRSSDIVIVDALTVVLGVLFLIAAYRRASPRQSCLAGIFAGLALYGYGGGRLMPVVFLIALPLIVLRSAAARGRRILLLAALLSGLLFSAAPSVRFAASHFSDWNGRLNTTSVFAPEWHREEVRRLGSSAKVLSNQIRFGTLGRWLGVLPFLGDRVRYRKRAACIDEKKREVRFADGTARGYDRLLSTLPLDALVARLTHAPERVRAAAKKLLANRLFSVGVGLKRPSPSPKNWIYFPNPKTPFYRITYLSNYSPDIVPGGDTSGYCSILTETTYSPFRPLPPGDFAKAVLNGLVAEGILEEIDLARVESTTLIHAGHAYPIPTVDRNAALEIIQPYLESHEIYSRGRFGSWKYEIGNQDHSLMQGVELVDRWLDGSEEKVFRS